MQGSGGPTVPAISCAHSHRVQNLCSKSFRRLHKVDLLNLQTSLSAERGDWAGNWIFFLRLPLSVTGEVARQMHASQKVHTERSGTLMNDPAQVSVSP